MSKLVKKETIIEQFEDGQSFMVGGFMEVGAPENLLDLVIESDVKDLTLITNDTGFPEKKLGSLIVNKLISGVIASHVGTNPETGKQMNQGEIDVELIPQGTLAERIRSKGAGLGGILTPTGVGTVVEENKKKISLDGEEYLLEKPLGADIALLKAWKADETGNLIYRYAARNFNPLMAMAADLVIVEAEEILPVGKLDPNKIMTPGIFVDQIISFSNN